MELPHRRTAGLKRIAFFALLLGCVVGGCRTWDDGVGLPFNHAVRSDTEKKPSGADSPSGNSEGIRSILATSRVTSETGLGPSVWVRNTSNSGATESRFQWRYPALDDLLGRSGENAVDWEALAADSDPTVAASAAMALARLGRQAPAAPLAAAVRDPTLPFEMRCAAAESLGAAAESLSAAEASEGTAAIRNLIGQYGDYTPQGRSHYIAELHAELIRALGRRVDPFRDDLIASALRAPAAEARLAAVDAVASAEAGKAGELPKGVVDARLDGDARVRAAAIRAIVRHDHPKKLEYAAKALKDMHREPRAAAIDSLGELSDEASLALLNGVMQDGGELDRTDAADALARRGAKELLLAAAKDKSSRVRMAVARGLAQYADPEGVQTVRLLFKDPSGQVRAEAVRAAAKWPLRQAGPILLEAMALRTTVARKEATSALADLWRPAREFPVNADAKERAEALASLRTRYAEEVGFPAEVAARDDAAPKAASAAEIAAADELRSSDRNIRRRAARTLLRLSTESPLHPDTIGCVVENVVRDDDALLWQTALEIVVKGASEDARRLAVSGLGHPDAEVRRRACVCLAENPDPKNAGLLAEILDDANEGVATAAMRALGACGPESAASAQPALERLLGDPNPMLQVEGAAVLAKWGVQSGVRGLERATLGGTPAVRRRAAEAMGELGDPAFLPHLIRLLDDRQHVRLAALKALSKAVGDDKPGIAGDLTTTEKATRWKLWYESERGTRAAKRPDGTIRE